MRRADCSPPSRCTPGRPGASTGTAGLTTTALTFSSVATYLVTPRLMAGRHRAGWQAGTATGAAPPHSSGPVCSPPLRGVLALSLAAIPAAVIAGAGVFGLGFGVTQNAI